MNFMFQSYTDTFSFRFQIIFTLTPPTADPDKHWPAIVWKVAIIDYHLATFSYLVFI